MAKDKKKNVSVEDQLPEEDEIQEVSVAPKGTAEKLKQEAKKNKKNKKNKKEDILDEPIEEPKAESKPIDVIDVDNITDFEEQTVSYSNLDEENNSIFDNSQFGHVEGEDDSLNEDDHLEQDDSDAVFGEFASSSSDDSAEKAGTNSTEESFSDTGDFSNEDQNNQKTQAPNDFDSSDTSFNENTYSDKNTNETENSGQEFTFDKNDNSNIDEETASFDSSNEFTEGYDASVNSENTYDEATYGGTVEDNDYQDYSDGEENDQDSENAYNEGSYAGSSNINEDDYVNNGSDEESSIDENETTNTDEFDSNLDDSTSDETSDGYSSANNSLQDEESLGESDSYQTSYDTNSSTNNDTLPEGDFYRTDDDDAPIKKCSLKETLLAGLSCSTAINEFKFDKPITNSESQFLIDHMDSTDVWKDDDDRGTVQMRVNSNRDKCKIKGSPKFTYRKSKKAAGVK